MRYVLLLFVVVGLACEAKPAPGRNCKFPGRFVCADSATALLCNAGTFEAVPCRGPRGCTGGDVAPMCDDRTATAGEPCMSPGAHSCAADRTRGLVCEARRWSDWRACKGARGCVAADDRVECDATSADVGDPCDEGAFACARDGAALLACKGGRMDVARSCRGAGECKVELGSRKTDCDDSIAREGDACESGARACSEDRKRELVCEKGRFARGTECACTPQRDAKPLCERDGGR